MDCRTIATIFLFYETTYITLLPNPHNEVGINRFYIADNWIITIYMEIMLNVR